MFCLAKFFGPLLPNRIDERVAGTRLLQEKQIDLIHVNLLQEHFWTHANRNEYKIVPI